MHFSIPDTQELKEESGSSSYTGYNIHINGLYHCTVRYKQLYNLNEQLKRIHDVPTFPPKKFLPLSSSQLDERRCHLEKYIQTVGQTPNLASTDVFKAFLLSAQLESSKEKNKEISMEAFRMDGSIITVKCNINESSSQVLEKICRQIKLPLVYMYYFALFLVNRDAHGVITIVRRLQDFESPYISQKTIKDIPTRLVIRKSYWDPEYDFDLSGDRVAQDLLYRQTVSDLEQGWIVCTTDTQAKLATLEAKEAKREYMEIARNLKFYGYIQFQPCTSNYPIAGTQCIVSAGYKELSLRVTLDGGEIREGAFKVTRMKCWRITIHNDVGNESLEGERREGEPGLELSFEYLMAKDQLQWIRILSDQAIFMSVCLQSMVDELLLKKVGAKIKQPSTQAKNGSYNYMKRDGSNHQISLSQSSSFDCLTSPTVKTLQLKSKWALLNEINRASCRDIVLEKINKVDQEISSVQAVLTKLEKKECELNNAAHQTVREEDSPPEQPIQLPLFQKIYEDNRKKASNSHLSLEKLGPTIKLPLYNQPSDTLVYHENIRKHSLFKESLLIHLRDKKDKREKREKFQAQTYSRLMKEWHMEVEKIENSIERKTTQAKYREIFEKEFPSIKDEREKQERIAQELKKGPGSDEFTYIRNQQELEMKKMRACAVIPPLLFDAEQRKFGYIDSNGKVEDFEAEYKTHQTSNLWTDDEKVLFRDKFLERPKDFPFIASYLKNKSVKECVQYYYHSKKDENYKLSLLRDRKHRSKLNNCFGVTTVKEVLEEERMRMLLNSGPGVTTRHQQKQLKQQNTLDFVETLFKPLTYPDAGPRSSQLLSSAPSKPKPDNRKRRKDGPDGPNGG